ncbi:MAG: transposase, partial [Treponema sp.]|nr:transposase [Treponema sp.]
AGLTAAKPEWLKGKNVSLVDGTEDVKCGVRRQCYMLHYSLDLFTLAAREFLITDMRTGEKLANFKQFGRNDIVMGDRIYGTLPGISYLRQRKAGYALRINSRGFTMYDGKYRKIDLLRRLSRLKEGKTADITGKCIINDRYEPFRVCAMRKDTDSERAGLKRLTKTNQRKRGGKPVSALQRENNKYIIVATSLGKEEAAAAQVLELYRTRWQIEIAFKRLKSLFHYNDLPAKNKESVKAWFYGKLLLAALCETLVNTGRFSPSEEM